MYLLYILQTLSIVPQKPLGGVTGQRDGYGLGYGLADRVLEQAEQFPVSESQLGAQGLVQVGPHLYPALNAESAVQVALHKVVHPVHEFEHGFEHVPLQQALEHPLLHVPHDPPQPSSPQFLPEQLGVHDGLGVGVGVGVRLGVGVGEGQDP